jgi:hypothetical protein
MQDLGGVARSLREFSIIGVITVGLSNATGQFGSSFSPGSSLSDPLNGAPKRPTPKANS